MDADENAMRLYRISWRWRALVAALCAAPVGWMVGGVVPWEIKLNVFSAGITRIWYRHDDYSWHAVAAAVFAAVVALLIARAKHPAAYWPCNRGKS